MRQHPRRSQTLPSLVRFGTVQDAVLMLQESGNRHTKQLGEIFRQAGKLYGGELVRWVDTGRSLRKGTVPTEATQRRIGVIELVVIR